MTYRLFIVEDHPLMRETLTEYLALEPDVEVCGQAASGEEALRLIPESACDLVLVDVSMPGMSGIEFVRQLRQLVPGQHCLMLSGHAEKVYVEAALAAGAQGYVMKGDPDAMVTAIRRVLGGEATSQP